MVSGSVCLRTGGALSLLPKGPEKWSSLLAKVGSGQTGSGGGRDSGQGPARWDVAGVSVCVLPVLPGQVTQRLWTSPRCVAMEKGRISKDKFNPGCELPSVDSQVRMPGACTSSWALCGLGGGEKGGVLPRVPVGAAVTGSFWEPQPREGVLSWSCSLSPPKLPLTLQAGCPHPHTPVGSA